MQTTTRKIFGEQVGRYTLLEKLGEGGMATVYNAYDAHRGINVAIKIILSSRRDSKEFLERFEVESKAVAQLSHTNIVKVLDYGEINGSPYLVMEYVPGGTLKDFMTGPVPYALAAKIVLPIARALDYVHTQGIIHRDVKPANILIDEDDQPKLSDFGVIQLLESKEKEEQSVTGVGIGTPDYMSPEQGMGKAVDSRADIYALGVIFYELITGQKPFTADTPMAIAIKHATEPFPRPSKVIKELPRVVERTLMKAVAKDSSNRYQRIGEFADALEIIAKDENLKKDVRLRKIITGRSSQKRSAPKTSLALAGAILLVALLGGFLNRDRLMPIVSSMLPVAQIYATPPGTGLPAQPVVLELTSGPAVQASMTPSPSATLSATSMFTPTSLPEKASATSVSTATSQTKENIPYSAVNKKITARNLVKVDLWEIGGVTSVDWSPDQSIITIGTTEGVSVLDGNTYQTIKFFDLDQWVELVQFSQDGRWIYAGLRNGTVIVWSVMDDYSEFKEIKYRKFQFERIIGDPQSPVQAVAFQPDQELVAIGYKNGGIQIYKSTDWSTIASFELYPSVKSLAFSKDGRLLYATRNESNLLRAFDLNSRQFKDIELPGSVSSMIVSPDGSKLLLGGLGEAVYLWDTATDRLLYSYAGLGNKVTSLAIDPDGQRIAAALANGKVRVYPIATEKDFYSTITDLFTATIHTDAITGISFSQDGGKIASTSIKDGLKVNSSETGEGLYSTSNRYSAVKRMEFSPNARWLAVDYDGEVVRVFDTYSGEMLFEYEGQMAKGNPFSNDGQYLIVLNSNRNFSLLVIEYPSGQIIQTLKGIDRNWQVGFSPDDAILVAGTMSQALIWDVGNWTPVASHGGPNSGCGMYFTPDNQLLATIWDGAIIFKLNMNIELLCATKPSFARGVHLSADLKYAIFETDGGGIWKFQYDPDQIGTDRKSLSNAKQEFFQNSSFGDQVYVIDKVKKLAVTDQNFGELFSFMNQDLYAYQAAVSPDNRLIALGSKFGNISIWGAK